MLNLHTKCIVLSRGIIWINKNYGEHVSRKENTKEHILQDEDKSYNWDHVKIDLVKNEVKNENVKTKENLKTEQNSRGEEETEDYQCC